MSTPKLTHLVSPEELATTKEALIQIVDNAMNARDSFREFWDAWRAAEQVVMARDKDAIERLANAGYELHHEALRVLIDVAHTATVMEAVGEFPTPDESRRDEKN